MILFALYYLCFFVFPFIHGAFLRREVDADLEDAAAVVLVGQDIVFGVDLLKGCSMTKIVVLVEMRRSILPLAVFTSAWMVKPKVMNIVKRIAWK